MLESYLELHMRLLAGLILSNEMIVYLPIDRRMTNVNCFREKDVI